MSYSFLSGLLTHCFHNRTVCFVLPFSLWYANQRNTGRVPTSLLASYRSAELRTRYVFFQNRAHIARWLSLGRPVSGTVRVVTILVLQPTRERHRDLLAIPPAALGPLALLELELVFSGLGVDDSTATHVEEVVLLTHFPSDIVPSSARIPVVRVCKFRSTRSPEVLFFRGRRSRSQ
ncbi:hypothetical protein F4801DRAFT_567715 [Xylaria longipes]|nr:hypothetical protein F4801DRAFT_567715 [Xylaria longipes]